MRNLVLLICLLLPAVAYSCQLKVRLEHFQPQSVKHDEQLWQGVDYEMINTFLRRAKCDYDIIEIPWIRSLDMLVKGEIDVMMNVTKTPRRERSFHFIGPISREVIVFASNEALVLNTIQDLVKLDRPIAIQRGAFYGEEMDKLINNPIYQHFFLRVTDNDKKLKLLRTGRISGYLEAKRNLTLGPEQGSRYEGVFINPLVIHETNIYFALSKKSVDEPLYLYLEKTYQKLAAEGFFQRH
ncbi:transporter substrate-binding domain-containing protein [Catenovulum sp. SM1970]|uniref:substrate-binding periplasmic protein n=1 Tax=Marinifaba aquimaris TaxID=2741323 RepID=UPI0015744E24|nr:transporter substrate-binding domain-containing protein [Marinifaba aquimaris]NTS75806.1 transporter substrate-binding domain-containing protein [Marinifaba aquimaris]